MTPDVARTFPVDFLFQGESIPDLEQLKPEELDAMRERFEAHLDKVESPEQDHLIQFGLARIHLLREEPAKASDILQNRIEGPFALEDYRLHYLASALALEGAAELTAGHPEKATPLLEKAHRLRMDLFQSFPENPYYDKSSKHLAELEKELGRAHLAQGQYESAVRFFRRSLARDFPDSEEHRLQLYRLLVQAYEGWQEYSGAIDMMNFLLDRQSDGQTLEEAEKFLERQATASEVETEDLRRFRSRVESLRKKDQTAVKPAPEEKPGPDDREPVVVEFYEALGRDDFPVIFSAGSRILHEHPGLRQSRKVRKELSRTLVRYLRKNSWNETLDKILQGYPLKPLNELAYMFWRNGLNDQAVKAYQRIVREFPNEVQNAHKALFFLGRIHEDQQNYDAALNYYRTLAQRYDYGPYYPAARFKVGWMLYLKKEWTEARREFEALTQSPEVSDDINAALGNPEEFLASALYWQAQVEERLEHPEIKETLLKRLVEEHPLEFYSLLARFELRRNPLDFLDGSRLMESAARREGLGDASRSRILRAEELVSIGLLKEARVELAFLNPEKGEPGFWIYLAQLRSHARDYQKAIAMSWSLSSDQDHVELSHTLFMLLFPQAYIDAAKRESQPYRLDPYLVLALMRQESAFNHEIMSSAKAIGLMQMIPSTAKTVARANGIGPLEHDDLKQPDLNIHLGVYYLNQLLTQFGDNPVYALASYNAGPNKIEQWRRLRPGLTPIEFIESIPYTETRNYVKRVLRNYVIYKSFYGIAPILGVEEMLTVREPEMKQDARP